MMKKNLVFLIAASLFLPGLLWAGDCLECHQKNGVTIVVPEIPPLRIMAGTTVYEFTLEQAFAFHGHECPGLTTAFLALGHGLKRLFGEEIPRRDDILIISRSPAGGIKDLIDLLMKGDNPALKTWAPDGMLNDQSRFHFTLMRKSTSELLDIRLNPGLLPEDFTRLKQKQKKQQSSREEDERLHGYIKSMILDFPRKSDSELFGNPQPRKVMLWGDVDKGEMDRRIRKLRLENKAQMRRESEGEKR
mgnify:CR=1 FL=1